MKRYQIVSFDALPFLLLLSAFIVGGCSAENPRGLNSDFMNYGNSEKDKGMVALTGGLEIYEHLLASGIVGNRPVVFYTVQGDQIPDDIPDDPTEMVAAVTLPDTEGKLAQWYAHHFG